MNIKGRLEHIAHHLIANRDTGLSKTNAEAAKQTNGIVLAASFDHAKHIQKSFGVVAKSMETNLDGVMGPFHMDHYAISQLLMKAARKIEKLENEVEKHRTALVNALGEYGAEKALRDEED